MCNYWYWTAFIGTQFSNILCFMQRTNSKHEFGSPFIYLFLHIIVMRYIHKWQIWSHAYVTNPSAAYSENAANPHQHLRQILYMLKTTLLFLAVPILRKSTDHWVEMLNHWPKTNSLTDKVNRRRLLQLAGHHILHSYFSMSGKLS